MGGGDSSYDIIGRLVFFAFYLSPPFLPRAFGLVLATLAFPFLPSFTSLSPNAFLSTASEVTHLTPSSVGQSLQCVAERRDSTWALIRVLLFPVP